MGARNGVTAAMMAQAGFSGVPDVLEGEHNGLEAHSTQPRPEEMASGLGSRFYVRETAIKTFLRRVPDPVRARRAADTTTRARPDTGNRRSRESPAFRKTARGSSTTARCPTSTCSI
jgi:2-methylcitrate dehydratase PrpD